MEPAVLIVEDERIIALDMRLKLRKLGFAVPGVAHTGADALRMAAELKPDIVLMDIMLEGDMDGVEAAQELRRTSAVPVVFVSACNDSPTKSRALETEASSFVNKPVDLEHLKLCINTMLAKFGLRNKSS